MRFAKCFCDKAMGYIKWIARACGVWTIARNKIRKSNTPNSVSLLNQCDDARVQQQMEFLTELEDSHSTAPSKGDGYGYDYGNGSGDGYGYGYDYGNGYDYGKGDGYGYGYGNGYGNGYGYGYGYGNGNGSGDGW